MSGIQWRRIRNCIDLSIIVSTVVAVPLLILDLALGGSTAAIGEFIKDFFMAGLVLGNTISGPSYFGRAASYIRGWWQRKRKKADLEEDSVPLRPYPYTSSDLPSDKILLEEFDKPAKKPVHYEKILTLVGIAIGLLVSLTLTVLMGLHVESLGFFLNSLPQFLQITLLVLMCLGMTSGYFARIGRTLDQTYDEKGLKKKIKSLNHNHWLSIILAVTVGLALTAFMFVDGGLTGLTLAEIIFTVVALNTTLVSGSSYFARGLDFFTGGHTVLDYFKWCVQAEWLENDNVAIRMLGGVAGLGLFIVSLGGLLAVPVYAKKYRAQHEEGRATNERIATVIGVTLGLAVGIGLLFTPAGAAVLPFFFAFLPKVVGSIFFVTGVVSTFGGASARLGRVCDHLYKEGHEKVIAKEAATAGAKKIKTSYQSMQRRLDERPRYHIRVSFKKSATVDDEQRETMLPKPKPDEPSRMKPASTVFVNGTSSGQFFSGENVAKKAGASQGHSLAPQMGMTQ